MKYILFVLFLLVSNRGFSNDAIVIVFQASLRNAPNDNATILQHIRKGERVYIPASLDLTKPLPLYIQTLDKIGNTAFIKSQYIKIITNDSQEEQWPNSIGSYDPTDYRIEEPIPATYPYMDHEYKRATIELSGGTNPHDLFDYGLPFAGQTYSYESGIRFFSSQKLNSDRTNRHYVGIIGGVSSVNNSFIFTDGSTAIQSRTLFRLGPFYSYDTFRNSKLRLILGAGVTLNYHRSAISISDALGNSDQQFFTGISLSPLISTTLAYDNFVPGLDFLMGTDLYLYLPHSQSAPNLSSSPVIWNSNKIQSSFRTQVSLFIGVQTKY